MGCRTDIYPDPLMATRTHSLRSCQGEAAHGEFQNTHCANSLRPTVIPVGNRRPSIYSVGRLAFQQNADDVRAVSSFTVRMPAICKTFH